MIELQNFYNEGFGWICRSCDAKLYADGNGGGPHSRAFREGEAESKTPILANRALARWMDRDRRFLICPRCGVTEDTFIN